MTLPPTFIQRERDSGVELCLFGRFGQRGLARSFAGCAASGPVAKGRFGRTRRGSASQVPSGGVRCCSPCAKRPAWRGRDAKTEERLVQELIAQATVEALDEGVLGRLAGCDAMPVKLAISNELRDRVSGELGTVIAGNRLGLAANDKRRGQFPHEPCALQRSVCHQREAVPRAFIDHGHDPEAAAILQLIRHKIQ